MEFSSTYDTQAAQIAALFEASFTASEGAEEGARIGALARRLMAETPARDLRVVSAWEGAALVGCICFSRLSYDAEARTVFMLAPVAVAPDRQGQGIGQRLIRHGLDALRGEGVEVAVTYGDPNFYARVGFAPVSEVDLPAPHPLQFPHGWQAQSLTDAQLTPLRGPVRAVAAFDDPAFW